MKEKSSPAVYVSEVVVSRTNQTDQSSSHEQCGNLSSVITPQLDGGVLNKSPIHQRNININNSSIDSQKSWNFVMASKLSRENQRQNSITSARGAAQQVQQIRSTSPFRAIGGIEKQTKQTYDQPDYNENATENVPVPEHENGIYRINRLIDAPAPSKQDASNGPLMLYIQTKIAGSERKNSSLDMHQQARKYSAGPIGETQEGISQIGKEGLHSRRTNNNDLTVVRTNQPSTPGSPTKTRQVVQSPKFQSTALNTNRMSVQIPSDINNLIIENGVKPEAGKDHDTIHRSTMVNQDAPLKVMKKSFAREEKESLYLQSTNELQMPGIFQETQSFGPNSKQNNFSFNDKVQNTEYQISLDPSKQLQDSARSNNGGRTLEMHHNEYLAKKKLLQSQHAHGVQLQCSSRLAARDNGAGVRIVVNEVGQQTSTQATPVGTRGSYLKFQDQQPLKTENNQLSAEMQKNLQNLLIKSLHANQQVQQANQTQMQMVPLNQSKMSKLKFKNNMTKIQELNNLNKSSRSQRPGTQSPPESFRPGMNPTTQPLFREYLQIGLHQIDLTLNEPTVAKFIRENPGKLQKVKPFRGQSMPAGHKNVPPKKSQNDINQLKIESHRYYPNKPMSSYTQRRNQDAAHVYQLKSNESRNLIEQELKEIELLGMKQFGSNTQAESVADMEPITQSNYPNNPNSRFSRQQQQRASPQKNQSRPLSQHEQHEITIRTEKEFNKTRDHRSPGDQTISGQMEINQNQTSGHQSPSSYLLQKTGSGPSALQHLQSGPTTRRTAKEPIVATTDENGHVINQFNFDVHGTAASPTSPNVKSMIKFVKMDPTSQVERQLHRLSPFDSQKEWKQIDLSDPVQRELFKRLNDQQQNHANEKQTCDASQQAASRMNTYIPAGDTTVRENSRDREQNDMKPIKRASTQSQFLSIEGQSHIHASPLTPRISHGEQAIEFAPNSSDCKNREDISPHQNSNQIKSEPPNIQIDANEQLTKRTAQNAINTQITMDINNNNNIQYQDQSNDSSVLKQPFKTSNNETRQRSQYQVEFKKSTIYKKNEAFKSGQSPFGSDGSFLSMNKDIQNIISSDQQNQRKSRQGTKPKPSASKSSKFVISSTTNEQAAGINSSSHDQTIIRVGETAVGKTSPSGIMNNELNVDAM